ncbi:MAG: helix-turn-helix domain-containing protein [Ktedonobacteraceae bacterium]
MDLAEKVKHLRAIEGELRGLGRPMTQVEIVKAMQEELHESISQAYMSQLESGKRVHLTASSRELLARFFKVHPGYLVSDPPDFSTDLLSTDLIATIELPGDRLQAWLSDSVSAWVDDPTMQIFLSRLASVENPRSYLMLFARLLDLPLADLERVLADLHV